MQSFAGAETTRRFSSILNNTWPKDMPPAEISSIAIRGAGWCDSPLFRRGLGRFRSTTTYGVGGAPGGVPGPDGGPFGEGCEACD
jgi:hypothetical protein